MLFLRGIIMKKENQTHSRSGKRRVKKKRRNKKALLFIFIPLLLLITATSVYAFNILNKAQVAVEDAYEDDGRERSNLREYNVDPGKDHVSVLFIGVDSSEHRDNEDFALSDALILATLNKDDSSVKLLSIPRDSLVEIPAANPESGPDIYDPNYRGKAIDKITHAHAYGGSSATIGAVENLLEIPVDYFVRLNFHAFVDVVDALGGITFDVPYEFSESDSNDRKNSIHLYPGVQKLNGEEALAVARTRKLDSDLERGKRQQQLMESILNKVVSFESINNLDSVIEAVGNNMGTNLRFNEMMGFASYVISGNLELEMVNMEGTDLWTDLYYYQLDEAHLAETRQLLKHHLGLIDESEMTIEVVGESEDEELGEGLPEESWE